MTKAYYFPEPDVASSSCVNYFENVPLEIPVLTPEQIASIFNMLRENQRRYLVNISYRDIIKVIDNVCRKWLNPDYEFRKAARALLPSLNRYSHEMIEFGIPLMLSHFTEENLLAVLNGELRFPDALDRFVANSFGRCRSYGFEIVTHVCAGNVPGVSLSSVIYALIAKSAGFVKTSSGDPVFPILFIKSLAEIEPKIGKCLAGCWWDRGMTLLTESALKNSDLVVAYGNDDTIKDIKERTPGRFIGYGNKISFSVVSREALQEYLAQAKAVARDVSIFDQQGCLSPHVCYVETGGKVTPREFAALVAAALEEIRETLPIGLLSLGEAGEIHRRRGSAEFQKIAGKPVEMWTSPGGIYWTVIYEEDSTFRLSCLNRLLLMKPVRNIDMIPQLLQSWKPYLQTVGVAIPEERLIPFAEQMGQLGVNRVCQIGKMQSPAAGWHHDGLPVISQFLRWVDIEDDASNLKSNQS